MSTHIKNSLFENGDFDKLCMRVQNCSKCERMCESQRVLNRSGGSLEAEVMFIGEAPGRLGADSSGIPFHGDKSGHNFEDLLDFANLSRFNIFVTNSVLCNPKDEKKNNSTPTKLEIQNCSEYLGNQIQIINPKIVVTLGSTALEATRFISNHFLTLKENVRTANKWFDRILIPLYHPGQRAMMHRSFANQRSDYQFVAEKLKKLKTKRISSVGGKVNSDIISIVKSILSNVNSVDYFKLHKLYYLVEYHYFKKHQQKLTNAYIVRQKDGPYCTDLHVQKLKKQIPELIIKEKNGNISLSMTSDLFNDPPVFNNQSLEIVKDVIGKYGALSNGDIKTKVYLTDPMRNLLKLEQNGKINLYNSPIVFV